MHLRVHIFTQTIHLINILMTTSAIRRNGSSLLLRAVLQPGCALFAQFLLRPLLIRLAFLLGQHILPSRVGALVDEALRTLGKDIGSLRWRREVGVLLHPVKSAMLDTSVPLLLGHLWDIEELGNLAHLAVEISLEVIVMQEQHVGLVARLPPAADVAPEGPQLLAGGLVVEKLLKEVAGVVGRADEFGAVKGRTRGEELVELGVCGLEVVVGAPDCVAAVATDKDVLDVGVPDHGIAWEMGLEASSVGLAFHHAQHRFTRDDTDIDPRGSCTNTNGRIAFTDQLCDDLLCPLY